MNSCLYACQMSHRRLSPKKHDFSYGVFFFYLDLDEIDVVTECSRLFKRGKAAIYSFEDRDFIDRSSQSVKKKVLTFLSSTAPEYAQTVSKITLLTTVRTFGYIFNPVSIYYCFADSGSLVCAIAEVTNTFYESKLYFLCNENATGDYHSQTIKSRKAKYFYVSPFSELDSSFDFTVVAPGDELQLNINTFQNSQPTLLSVIKGRKVALTAGSLTRLSLRYPLMSMRVIFLIHWHALQLFLKGVPYFSKEANTNLQTDVRHPHISLTGKGGAQTSVVDSFGLESPQPPPSNSRTM